MGNRSVLPLHLGFIFAVMATLITAGTGHNEDTIEGLGLSEMEYIGEGGYSVIAAGVWGSAPKEGEKRGGSGEVTQPGIEGDKNCEEGMGPLRPMVLRVGTFNIHHGEGRDGFLNLRRIADVIREMDVDVLGLQEVDRNWGKRSGWADQVMGLTSILGIEGRFGPALSRWGVRGRGYYGNAILSRFPILRTRNHSLQGLEGREDRAYLQALIDIGGEKVVFISIHLGLSERERRHHLSMLLSDIESSPYPVIVAGDFNDSPDSELIKMMNDRMTDTFSVAGKGDGATFNFRSTFPNVRIDYIWVSDRFEVLDASTLPTEASDHYPVMATVRLLTQL